MMKKSNQNYVLICAEKLVWRRCFISLLLEFPLLFRYVHIYNVNFYILFVLSFIIKIKSFITSILFNLEVCLAFIFCYVLVIFVLILLLIFI